MITKAKEDRKKAVIKKKGSIWETAEQLGRFLPGLYVLDKGIVLFPVCYKNKTH